MLGRILITGSHGQLGTELSKLLPDAILTGKEDLDITDFSAVRKFVKAHGIEIIVNCAAYTAVDKAENECLLAEKINALGPENLAKTGCKIVHISTDYVFDGKHCQPYTPDDVTNPLSVYGRTKRAGELAVLNNAKEAVVIRTAWLYSSCGNNFVKTMKRLGGERENINVVFDQIGTPTYAGDLAEAIVKILPLVCEKTKGIYHFTNEGVCSWYDFAVEIMKKSGLHCQVNPISSSSYPTKAIRPFYSVLDKSKIKNTFGVKIAHWREAFERS